MTNLDHYRKLMQIVQPFNNNEKPQQHHIKIHRISTDLALETISATLAITLATRQRRNRRQGLQCCPDCPGQIITQWAVDVLQYTTPLPGGSGQWTSCNTLPPCLGAVGSALPAVHCPAAGGSGQWTSCNTLSHCLGAVGSGSPAVYCPTAWGEWAVELLQYTASLPGDRRQWTSCSTLPRSRGQRAVDLLQYTVPLLGGSGRWTSCSTLPHCLGQWAVDLLQYTAPLPGVSGQWTCCNTLPHCLGAVGSGTPAVHCPAALGAAGSGPLSVHWPTAWGEWAVDLPPYITSLPGGCGQWTPCNRLPGCLGAAGRGPPSMHCPTASEPLRLSLSVLPVPQWLDVLPNTWASVSVEVLPLQYSFATGHFRLGVSCIVPGTSCLSTARNTTKAPVTKLL